MSVVQRAFGALMRVILRGLLVTVPATITAWVLYVIGKIALSTAGELTPWLGRWPLGLALFASVLALGGLASSVTGRFVLEKVEMGLLRLPLIRMLYGSVRGLAAAFLEEDSKFKYPVRIKVNATGLERIGFLVQADLSPIDIKDRVAVYLPSSYGLGGKVVLARPESVRPLHISGLDAMNFVVAGGVTDIDALHIERHDELMIVPGEDRLRHAKHQPKTPQAVMVREHSGVHNLRDQTVPPAG